MITASRIHDFSAGHRVAGHENKCANLHGHNYRVTFHCTANELDSIGRVVDFSVMKEHYCAFLERNWDHKFLMWEHDPLRSKIAHTDDLYFEELGIILVPFNPTAENMARYLVELFRVHGDDLPILYRVDVQETRKCGATYILPGYLT